MDLWVVRNVTRFKCNIAEAVFSLTVLTRMSFHYSEIHFDGRGVILL